MDETNERCVPDWPDRHLHGLPLQLFDFPILGIWNKPWPTYFGVYQSPGDKRKVDCKYMDLFAGNDGNENESVNIQ